MGTVVINTHAGASVDSKNGVIKYGWGDGVEGNTLRGRPKNNAAPLQNALPLRVSKHLELCAGPVNPTESQITGAKGACVPELNRKVAIPVSAPNLTMRFRCWLHDRTQGLTRNRPVNLTESQISGAKVPASPNLPERLRFQSPPRA